MKNPLTITISITPEELDKLDIAFNEADDTLYEDARRRRFHHGEEEEEREWADASEDWANTLSGFWSHIKDTLVTTGEMTESEFSDMVKARCE